uniref:Cathepsin L n=1 Tax=Rousettus aegyptiacus TaxID=9407 RepID=A0A7J8IHV7_ROUAE|nr:cathepsin L [Rousettus aegyptiacus]
MNPYILVTLLCLGIASAAPTVDHSADAQLNLLKADLRGVFDKLKDTLKKAVLEKIAKEIEKHLHGKDESEENQNVTTAVRAFSDMAIVKSLEKYELTPEPEAQKGESTPAEIPLSVDSREEGYVTPAMRK